MKFSREEELQIFRNVNGFKKKWRLDNSGADIRYSSKELDLRKNQGASKSKLIKFILKSNVDLKFWTTKGGMKHVNNL